MINKKNIWFLTLFSLILVLSVYYITMPSDLLNTPSIPEEKVVEEINESSVLVALRVDDEEEYEEELETIKEVLTSKESTTEEKNNAYDKMKSINSVRSEQEKLENLVKEKYGFNSFIKIDSNQIRVVIEANEHDVKLANQIMRLIQSKYTNKMYITVKFQ